MTRHDPHDLFAADNALGIAQMNLIRAVTAGENNRYSEQRGLVDDAVVQIAKALKRLVPATHEGTAPALSAPVGRG